MMNDTTLFTLQADLNAALARAPNNRNEWPKVYEIRRTLALEYGRRHGWKLRETGTFRLFDLFRESKRATFYPIPHEPVDHSQSYADQEGRAAAVASFEYNSVEPIQRWATLHGLTLTQEVDFPNFYSPYTHFLVFTVTHDERSLNAARIDAYQRSFKSMTGRRPRLEDVAEAWVRNGLEAEAFQ